MAIINLNKNNLSPNVLLHQTLDDIENIKAVTIITQYKNESIEVNWSNQTIRDFCTASKIHEIYCDRIMNGIVK